MFTDPPSGLITHVYRTTQWTEIVRHIFGLLLLQSCILLVGCIVGCNPETGLSWLQSWHLFKLVAKLKLVQSDCKAETCSSWLQS